MQPYELTQCPAEAAGQPLVGPEEGTSDNLSQPEGECTASAVVGLMRGGSQESCATDDHSPPPAL
jgi:hypothetical protein